MDNTMDINPFIKIEIEESENDLLIKNSTSIKTELENDNNNFDNNSETSSLNNSINHKSAITSNQKNSRVRKSKNKMQNNQKIDAKAKLERSRQSARECRARKKLRYQYLEDLVNKRENANLHLKQEIEDLKKFANKLASDEHPLDSLKMEYRNIR